MMKKTLYSILAVSLSASLCAPIAHAAEIPAYLTQGKEENLNNLLAIPSISDATFMKLPDGRKVAVAASAGYGSRVNVIDLDTKKVIKDFLIGDPLVERQMYGSWATDNGHVIAGFSNGELFDIDIVNATAQKIEFPSNAIKPDFIWDVAQGDGADLYFGTYRSGQNKRGTVFKYNYKTKELKDYGVVKDSANYVRSIGYGNGKIYAGLGTGSGNNHIVEIDANNPKNKKDLPANNLYADDYNKVSFMANLTVHNGYLYAVPESEKATSIHNEFFVFDIAKQQWVDRIEETAWMGNQAVPYQGDSVIVKNTQGHLSAYDPNTQQLTPLRERNFPCALRSDSYIDNTIYGFSGKAMFCSYDIDTKTYHSFDVSQTGFQASERNIETIGEGDDTNIYVAPFFPTDKIRKVNPYQDASEIAQTPGIVNYSQAQVQFLDNMKDDWMITGSYPAGYVVATNMKDPSQTVRVDIGNDQIRPTHMTKISDTVIAVTSSPKYGYRYGGVSIIDLAQGKLLSFTPIENMSPSDIEYANGKLYVGTNRNIGGGAPVVEQEGKLLMLDAKTGKILKEKVVLPYAFAVSSVTSTKDGRIFVSANNNLYEVDKDTLDIKQTHKGADRAHYSGGEAVSAHNGLIFSRAVPSTGSREIVWIDPDDISHQKVITEGYHQHVHSESGDIYYRKPGKNKDLFRLDLPIDFKDYNQPTYAKTTVQEGEKVTIALPRDNGRKLSSGTVFTKGKGFPDWVTLNKDGSLQIDDVSQVESDSYKVPVLVKYQDGSKETITADVVVKSNYKPTTSTTSAPETTPGSPASSPIETPSLTDVEDIEGTFGQDTTTSVREDESTLETSPSFNEGVLEDNKDTSSHDTIDTTLSTDKEKNNSNSQDTIDNKNNAVESDIDTSSHSRGDKIDSAIKDDGRTVLSRPDVIHTPNGDSDSHSKTQNIVNAKSTAVSASPMIPVVNIEENSGPVVHTGGKVQDTLWDRISSFLK